MGQLTGHLYPGLILSTFSLWWTVNIFKRYFRSLEKDGTPYYSTLTFPCFVSKCFHRWFKPQEIEGWIFVFIAVGGFFEEVFVGWAGFNNRTFPVYTGNFQHCTMYFFYGIAGAVEILHQKQLPVPKGLEYATMAMAAVITGTLFNFHLHGKSEVNVAVHTLLLYVIVAIVTALMLEMKLKENVMPALGRAYLFQVQGVWLIIAGFIFQNPFPGSTKWDGNDPGQIRLVAILFTWTLGGVALNVAVIAACVGVIIRRK